MHMINVDGSKKKSVNLNFLFILDWLSYKDAIQALNR